MSKCKDNGKVLRVGLYKCGKCSYPVEIFSDEAKTVCPNCGALLVKAKMHACVVWCANAKGCIGTANSKLKTLNLNKKTKK